jgi:hypothetical protein
MSTDIIPAIKQDKKKYIPFAAFGAIAVIAMMIMMNVPGGPAGTNVSATFGVPIYSDTFISAVKCYDSNGTLVTSWSKTINPDATPSIAIGTDINRISVEIQYNADRLAPGGTVSSHVDVHGTITTPTGAVTSLTNAASISGSYFWYEAQSKLYGTARDWSSLGYDLSEVGTYRIYFVMLIEIP